MKKLTVILITLCLLVGFAFTAIACADGALDKPEITIAGNVVRWNPVKNTERYSVNLTGENLEEQNIERDTNSITLGPFAADVKKVKVKVKAVGDNVNTKDSKYSNTVEYIPGNRLDTPQLNAVVKDGEDYKLTWNAIKDAAGYKIKMVCVGNSGKNKEYSVAGDVTQLIIARADMSTNSRYTFQIQALGNGGNIIESAWGGDTQYIVEDKLDTPESVYYNNTGIHWNKVNNAKEYNVFFALFSDSEYELLETVTTTSYRMDKLVANEKLKEGLKYKFSVSALNKDNSTIYSESDKAEVKDSNEIDAEIAEFTKLSAPKNISLQNGVLTFTGAANATAGYTIELQSGQDNKVEFKIDSTKDATAYSIDLDAKIKEKSENKSHFGRVYTIRVYANSNDTGSLAESKRLDVLDDNKIKSEYVYTDYFEDYADAKEWATHSIDGTNYKIVDNLEKFVYMLNHTDRFFLKEINGNGAKIYGGGLFTGVIEGDSAIVKNLKLVKKGAAGKYSLFEEIGEGAVVANITFVDCVMDSNVVEVVKDNKENDKINTFNENYIGKDSAFLTMVNKGTIKGIYYNAEVMVTGNHGGLVYKNNGKIINSNVSGTILAEGNVGGLVYENYGDLTGVYLTNATIKSTNVIDSAVSKAKTANKTLVAGGITAFGHGGNIKNSGVLNSIVAVDNKTINVSGIASGYAGGFIGRNTAMNISDCYVEKLTNSAIASAISVHLSGTAASWTRYSGGFIGESKSGKIADSYIRNVNIGGAHNTTGGVIAAISGDAANISVSNLFIIDNNSQVSGTKKDMLLPTKSSAVTVTGCYSVTSGVKSIYDNMIKCNLNQLKEKLKNNDKYLYNATLGIILSDTLIADNTLLNFSNTTTGRTLYAKVFNGTEEVKKPTIQAGITKNGNFVDRYVIGERIFFVTVKVK